MGEMADRYLADFDSGTPHELFSHQILKPIRLKVVQIELKVMCHAVKSGICNTPLSGSGNKAFVWRAFKLLSRLEQKKFALNKTISLTVNISEADTLLRCFTDFYANSPLIAGLCMKIESQI